MIICGLKGYGDFMRILIFTASTGGGHKRTAAAMKEYFNQTAPEHEVRITDGIKLTGKFFDNFVCGGYSLLVKKTPSLFGALYRSSDKKSPVNNICNGANKSKGKCLLPEIEEFKPDVIVSCHAFITTMLGDLKTKGKITVPVVSLITDFAPHFTYIAEGIDHYVVASEKMVATFKTKYGIDSSRVHPFGIPVYSRFREEVDRAEVEDKLGLSHDKKTILFMAGSFGVKDVLNIYKDTVSKAKGCQFAVITGNNKKLYDKFDAIKSEDTVLKMFVDNVEDYMHCADLIITKPGGLTVSESIQCALPMAIYSAYPGQESDNAEYLVNSGAAMMLGKNPGETIASLIKFSGKLQSMSDNCRRICRGNSSQQMLDLLCELAGENK